MTRRTVRRVQWRAGATGEAHGHRPGAVRTLCGRHVLTEALAWAIVDYCPTCLRLADPDALPLGIPPREPVR